jgi:hypothetical protein
MFKHVLEAFRLPLTIPRAIHGSGESGARVGSYIGCLMRSLLGGDIFRCVAMRWTG